MRSGFLGIILLALATLDGCSDTPPGDEEIRRLLEAAVNREIVLQRPRLLAESLPGTLVPDRVKVVNFRNTGGVIKPDGTYVTHVRFDLVVVLGTAEMASQRDARAELHLRRTADGWALVGQR